MSFKVANIKGDPSFFVKAAFENSAGFGLFPLEDARDARYL
jgi:hypothetical protein